jgi:hypothetical protein
MIACSQCVPHFAAVLPGELFEDMPVENAAAGKFCSLLHQIQDCVFSVGADEGQVAQVDDQFASFQVVAGVPPSGAQLLDPQPDKLPFHDQRALRRRLYCGNSEHVGSSDYMGYAMHVPRTDCGELPQTDESNGENQNRRCWCRRVSKSISTFFVDRRGLLTSRMTGKRKCGARQHDLFAVCGPPERVQ